VKNKKLILITGRTPIDERNLKISTEDCFEIVFLSDEKMDLTDEMYEAEIVICHSLFTFHDYKLFKNLKFVQLLSVGYEYAPKSEMNNDNILVNNIGDVYSNPISEWVILKILEILKLSKIYYSQQQEKIWVKNREIYELYDKNVFILGCGNIGKSIARKLKVFDSKIYGFDISKDTISSDFD